MIAIFSALEAEVRELKKEMVIKTTSIDQDCRIYAGIWVGKDILLVLSGVGKERAKLAAGLILNKYPVDALISSGFGGGLNNQTAAGDVVIYSALICEDKRGGGLQKDLHPDPRLFSAAAKGCDASDLRVLVGRGITISQVCLTPESKLKLGKLSGADVVDMESYWIGLTAAENNIPFLAARSIFDSVEDDLTMLSHITDDGEVKPLKALGYFSGHPGQLRKAVSFSTNSKKAEKNLAIFLSKLVKAI
jgi:adenosylhomocysteine nucleosidase